MEIETDSQTIPQLTPIQSSMDRKVHWNSKYVKLLLDSVENRLPDFKNKSIHKKIWDDIGSEMKVYGFTTEHCYNKWKNLRRDVRMFAINPQKNAKNVETLTRVRRLISTICPNFDPTAIYKKTAKYQKSSQDSYQQQSEESSTSLEPLAKLITPPASPFSETHTPPSGLNLKSEELAGDSADNSITSDQPPFKCLVNYQPTPSDLSTASASNSTTTYSTWPYELQELLLSFRTEELKQAHSIEQLVRYITQIRDSSMRRINTIEQLMNLATLLISSKLS